MEIIICILILQWVILLGWMFFSWLEDDTDMYPKLLITLLLIFIPLGMLFSLIVFIYRNDKENKNI